MTTQNDIARMALSLPEAAESGSEFGFGGGGQAVRLALAGAGGSQETKAGQRRGDRRACRRSGGKEALLASDPEKFFTTDHYDGCHGVLVRLPAVDVDELTELITDSWLLRAPTRLVDELERG
jgi:hypothetical protein